jgi:hypothetical protein
VRSSATVAFSWRARGLPGFVPQRFHRDGNDHDHHDPGERD